MFKPCPSVASPVPSTRRGTPLMDSEGRHPASVCRSRRYSGPPDGPLQIAWANTGHQRPCTRHPSGPFARSGRRPDGPNPGKEASGHFATTISGRPLQSATGEATRATGRGWRSRRRPTWTTGPLSARLPCRPPSDRGLPRRPHHRLRFGPRRAARGVQAGAARPRGPRPRRRARRLSPGSAEAGLRRYPSLV